MLNSAKGKEGGLAWVWVALGYLWSFGLGFFLFSISAAGCGISVPEKDPESCQWWPKTCVPVREGTVPVCQVSVQWGCGREWNVAHSRQGCKPCSSGLAALRTGFIFFSTHHFHSHCGWPCCGGLSEALKGGACSTGAIEIRSCQGGVDGTWWAAVLGLTGSCPGSHRTLSSCSALPLLHGADPA